MKKDKIIRKKIKSRKAKMYRKKNKGRKKENKEEEKMGKKVTWTWTSLNPPVSGRKTHPVARALRRGFERAFLAKLEPGLFPLSFPLSFPSFPLPWRRFSPSLIPFGMTLIARMKHEWNQWNEWNTKERRMKHERKTTETRKKDEWNTKERRMKQMKHEWNAWLAWSPLASQLRELDAGLGVVTAMDVLIFTVDSRLLFPLHLYFAKMPEAGPSDQEWRQNLSSFARPGRDSSPQGQSARPVSK